MSDKDIAEFENLKLDGPLPPDSFWAKFPPVYKDEFLKQRAEFIRKKTSRPETEDEPLRRKNKSQEMASPAPAAIVPPAKSPAKEQEMVAINEGDEEDDTPKPKVLVKRQKNAFLQTGRERPVLAGDKKDIIKGYKSMALCNQLVYDALQRAELAATMLDKEHSRIIMARLAKAGLTSANAAHQDLKEITFKKAVSIALQAERWVYEAQAAAAKHMVKESKHCLHALAGKRKLSKEEKDARWAAQGKGARGTKTDRAIAKAEKHLAALQESKQEQAAKQALKKKKT